MRRAWVAALLVLAAACGGPGGDGACELTVEFRGRSYTAARPGVRPLPGAALGFAVVPPCNDAGPAFGGDESYDLRVWAVPGVEPAHAVTSQGGEQLLVADDLGEAPASLARYLTPPGCRPEDEPIVLWGSGLEALPIGEQGENIRPPFDLQLFVENASRSRYRRAELSVRVPETIGGRLDPDTARAPHEGPPVRVLARCDPIGSSSTGRMGFAAIDVEVYWEDR